MNTIHIGDVREVVRALPTGSVHTAISSPPYWGLRDYGCEGQIGFERTPDEYVATIVDVMREVRRVLRDDGTLWLNLGDSYIGAPGGFQGTSRMRESRTHAARIDHHKRAPGMQRKDLVGIPWQVAFALRADGWILRQDIIWNKSNPMPESVHDRCTRSHEYIFLLAKQRHYYFDQVAIREEAVYGDHPRNGVADLEPVQAPGMPAQAGITRLRRGGNKGDDKQVKDDGLRNKRSVWDVSTAPFKGAHFATFPPELIVPCILAGSSAMGCCGLCGAPFYRQTRKHFKSQPDVTAERAQRGAGANLRQLRQKPHDPANGWEGHPRGLTSVETLGWARRCKCAAALVAPAVVFDPFFGAGTTGLVARRRGRIFTGIELNPDYAKMARERIVEDAPLLNRVAMVIHKPAVPVVLPIVHGGA